VRRSLFSARGLTPVKRVKALRKFVAVGEEQPAAFQVEEVFFGREVRGGVGFKPRLGGMPVAFADLVTELVQHDVTSRFGRSNSGPPRQFQDNPELVLLLFFPNLYYDALWNTIFNHATQGL
jgi:hypothetical protein